MTNEERPEEWIPLRVVLTSRELLVELSRLRERLNAEVFYGSQTMSWHATVLFAVKALGVQPLGPNETLNLCLEVKPKLGRPRKPSRPSFDPNA